MGTSTSAALGMCAVGLLSSCGPIVFYHDAEARESFGGPRPGAVPKVATSPLVHNRGEAINAVLRSCELSEVSGRRAFSEAAEQLKFRYLEGGLLNAYYTFECPATVEHEK